MHQMYSRPSNTHQAGNTGPLGRFTAANPERTFAAPGAWNPSSQTNMTQHPSSYAPPPARGPPHSHATTSHGHQQRPPVYSPAYAQPNNFTQHVPQYAQGLSISNAPGPAPTVNGMPGNQHVLLPKGYKGPIPPDLETLKSIAPALAERLGQGKWYADDKPYSQHKVTSKNPHAEQLQQASTHTLHARNTNSLEAATEGNRSSYAQRSNLPGNNRAPQTLSEDFVTGTVGRPAAESVEPLSYRSSSSSYSLSQAF